MDAKTARICYEDFEAGSVRTFGPRLVTREEIIEFATEFDPQPMHLDEEAAEQVHAEGALLFRLAHLRDHDAHAL